MRDHHDVYLDYSATTPVDGRVIEAMLPYFAEVYGNTSSVHRFGRKAEDAVESARETISRILNCKPNEVIFTSGGSESDNLAIRGAGWAAAQNGKGKHLITTPVEHSAVGHTVQQMVNMAGFEHSILPVDSYGLCDAEEFANAIQEGTTVASVIYANNEVGSISPLPLLAQHAHSRGIVFHTDAVQAAGQLNLDVQALGVDLMSISAHKFYGPKGVGALYCREGVPLVPNQTGGNHEAGRRAGTINTPGIVGMAKALELAYAEREKRVNQFQMLRDQLVEGILSRIPSAELTGHPEQRLPSHASFVLEDVESNMLLMHLDMHGIAASSGSACKTGNPEPSEVLLAMGYTRELAKGSIRLTVGQHTTPEDVEYVIGVLVKTVEKLRKLRKDTVL